MIACNFFTVETLFIESSSTLSGPGFCNPHHARVAENRLQPFSPGRPFRARPTLKLRHTVSRVSLTTSPVALDRDGLAE